VTLGLMDTSRTAQTPTMSRFTQANGLREPITDQTTTGLAEEPWTSIKSGEDRWPEWLIAAAGG
jgi:hypothetical protein